MAVDPKPTRGEVWRIRFEPSLSDGPSRFPRLSPDGKYVYSIGGGERMGKLWEMSNEQGTERQLTDFRGRRGSLSPEALATDGKYLYFSWRVDLGDIWVMDMVRE